ncbi:dihydrofolate reductase [Kocuria palustris]|uniref:Dihydrofolate reductase n=1 Tax=Kocuria palustris PEL TaxID=1236550 RepID=M2XFA5_9MICC|nr:dihydrofolate reductase [Kocuria palustris]EME37791.1 Dihydrofolate reductase [Kocuria palustris PEL]
MPAPRLSAIWAQTPDGVMGRDGGMPWHLPEDLAHFKATTQGHPVLMGRRTWESFPERFRPLPGRTNVVVTSRPEDPGLQADPREDGTAVIAVSSWREAVRAGAEAPGGEHLWVIGGARLLEDAMPELEHAVVTVIEIDEPGDTRAPRLETPWRLERRGEDRLSRTGLRWHVEHWRR